MRLTNGFLKNRFLKAADVRVRPTSEKVRQALFNILFSQQRFMEESTFLDCCAGSGCIGFEALSRGAKRVGFVECHRKNFTALKNNASVLNVKASCDFFFYPAEQLPACTTPYDIIYIDPPYRYQELYALILMRLYRQGWIAPNATIIMEMQSKITVDLPEFFTEFDRKNYGNTSLSFLHACHSLV